MQLRSTTIVTLSISAVLLIAVAEDRDLKEYRDKEVIDKCIAQENATLRDVDDYPHNIEILDWHPKESTLCAFKCMALDARLIQDAHIYPDFLKNFAALYDKLPDMYLMHAKYCLTNILHHLVHTCQDMKPVMVCIVKVMDNPMGNPWKYLH